MFEIAEGVVAGGCRGEETDAALGGMGLAPGHDGLIVVLYQFVGHRSGGGELVVVGLADAKAGLAHEDEVGYGMEGQIACQDGIVDSTVETAEDEGVDLLEGLDGSYGGLGYGRDAVVIVGHAVVGSDKLHTMFKACKTGYDATDGLLSYPHAEGYETGYNDIAEVVVALEFTLP